MRTMLIASVLGATVALVGALPAPAGASNRISDERDLPERDEINQTVELAPGARVDITDISGSVDIETADTRTAEIHIVRSARNRDDLRHRIMVVEHTPERLVIRTKQDPSGGWNSREVRQRVSLKLPRAIELTITDVSGRVRSAEIDGSVKLTDISGSVDLAQASGHAVITDISGKVNLAFATLSDRGLSIRDVSGSVDVALGADIGADLTVEDVSGKVSLDIPNATVHGKVNSESFQARIGAGGSAVSVTDVSGRIRFYTIGAGASLK